MQQELHSLVAEQERLWAEAQVQEQQVEVLV